MTSSRAPSSLLPLAAAGVTMLLWASAFIVIRAVGDRYAPGPMALGRLAVGALALGLVVVRPGPRAAVRLPRGRPLALVVGYGALWFGVYTVAVNGAEQHLDAGTTALLVNLAPIVIAVLAGLFLGEGFPAALRAGLVIAFGGVVVISVATSTGHYDLTGLLLALAAAGLYAVGVLLQKQALRDVDPVTATWLGCVVGALVCLPFAPGLVDAVRTAPVAATLGVAYLGLFPTAVAFSTWAYALARTDAGRLSASSYLVPGLAVLMSWAFLGEAPAPAALVGGALCVVGVAVTRRRTERPAEDLARSGGSAPRRAPGRAAGRTPGGSPRGPHDSLGCDPDPLRR